MGLGEGRCELGGAAELDGGLFPVRGFLRQKRLAEAETQLRVVGVFPHLGGQLVEPVARLGLLGCATGEEQRQDGAED